MGKDDRQRIAKCTGCLVRFPVPPGLLFRAARCPICGRPVARTSHRSGLPLLPIHHAIDRFTATRVCPRGGGLAERRARALAGVAL